MPPPYQVRQSILGDDEMEILFYERIFKLCRPAHRRYPFYTQLSYITPMTSSHDLDQPNRLEAALAFADQHLGPASSHYLRSLQGEVELLHLLENSPEKESKDIVLHLLHSVAGYERPISEEFFSYFLPWLMDKAHHLMRKRMRRLLESQDILNSMAGDVWDSLFDTEFRTEAEFKVYLGKRLGWKASDRYRALIADKRNVELDVPFETASILKPITTTDPADHASFKEEVERLLAALPRLSIRDREIVIRLSLGESYQEIADALKLSLESTHRAIARARARASAELGD